MIRFRVLWDQAQRRRARAPLAGALAGGMLLVGTLGGATLTALVLGASAWAGLGAIALVAVAAVLTGVAGFAMPSGREESCPNANAGGAPGAGYAAARRQDADPFRCMIETTVTGTLVLGPARQVLFANPAVARLLGLERPQELEGPAGLGPHLTDGAARALDDICQRIQDGTADDGQSRLEVIRADRGTAWLDVTARAMPWAGARAVVLTALDVTDLVLHERDLEFNRLDMEHRAVELVALAEDCNLERERAEVARREAEEQRRFLEALFSTIPNPLFYKDIQGRILGCNTAFARLYGRTTDAEMIGLTVHDLAPAAYAAETDSRDAELLAHGGAICYERVFAPDGQQPRTLIFNKAVYTDSAGAVAGIVGLVTDITEQKHLEEELRRLATTDPLTSLPNRRAFMEEATRNIARAERYDEPLSLILADLDHFKRINDSYGHATGDEVLKAFAGVVRGCLRDSDVPGRMGGEEFALVLPRTSLPQAMVLAERLQAVLAKTTIKAEGSDQDDGAPIRVTVSMGLAELGAHGRVVDALLQAADEALYIAKARGRNRAVAAAAPEGGAKPPQGAPEPEPALGSAGARVPSAP